MSNVGTKTTSKFGTAMRKQPDTKNDPISKLGGPSPQPMKVTVKTNVGPVPAKMPSSTK